MYIQIYFTIVHKILLHFWLFVFRIYAQRVVGNILFHIVAVFKKEGIHKYT